MKTFFARSGHVPAAYRRQKHHDDDSVAVAVIVPGGHGGSIVAARSRSRTKGFEGRAAVPLVSGRSTGFAGRTPVPPGCGQSTGFAGQTPLAADRHLRPRHEYDRRRRRDAVPGRHRNPVPGRLTLRRDRGSERSVGRHAVPDGRRPVAVHEPGNCVRHAGHRHSRSVGRAGRRLGLDGRRRVVVCRPRRPYDRDRQSTGHQYRGHVRRTLSCFRRRGHYDRCVHDIFLRGYHYKVS